MFLPLILGTTGWTPFDSKPFDCFLQGLITSFLWLWLNSQHFLMSCLLFTGLFLVVFFFKGLVGACGISVLYNLLRVYNFVQNSKWVHPLRGKRESIAWFSRALELFYFVCTQWFWLWKWKQTQVILTGHVSERELEIIPPVLDSDCPPLSDGLEGFLPDSARVFPQGCFYLGVSWTGELLLNKYCSYIYALFYAFMYLL